MTIFSVSKRSPVSTVGARINVVRPVTESPFSSAFWMGAAPRYSGSKDPCRFIHPCFGMPSNVRGNILNATTTKRSAFNSCNDAASDSLFSDSGCNRGISLCLAKEATGPAVCFIPLPFAVSAEETTATTSWRLLERDDSVGNAKTGLPRKTMRIARELNLSPLKKNFGLNRRDRIQVL